MQFLVLIVTLFAVSSAQSLGANVAVSQDTLGNYNLRYDIPGISRVEHRDIYGNVAGAFSYVDPYGIVRSRQFTSGVDGFNVFGNDIPVPVQDTPEVAQAKAEHLAKLHYAYLTMPPEPIIF
ncbi:hypothetical protein PPYR_07174 [Photinus pyralis]|uniref:Cuticle protein 7 n=1 Tax=Photinus pyralis TaxID=7054 RepID=A0A5N4APK9_PHOPY|nr:cuticle protein 7-like [Photinus pyralis]XP_031340923.1 cuticle protein 7-like [Photinus pyralis]KAB0799292.1 hypothetical protein PPYR_07172 [Photinus pyralis]KAB0799294.1 hypothetical protein PPYR_07174 [Photinus pyralis]